MMVIQSFVAFFVEADAEDFLIFVKCILWVIEIRHSF